MAKNSPVDSRAAAAKSHLSDFQRHLATFKKDLARLEADRDRLRELGATEQAASIEKEISRAKRIIEMLTGNFGADLGPKQ